MARVYANAAHQYTHFTDRGGTEYRWPANGWREVPDDVADVVCTAHPQKLVRLKPGENQPGEIKPPEPEPVVETVAEPVAEPVVEPVAEPVAETAEKPKIVLFRSVLKKKEQNK